MYGLPSNKEVAEKALEQLDKKLDAYEVILGKQKYLAGSVRSTCPSWRRPH